MASAAAAVAAPPPSRRWVDLAIAVGLVVVTALLFLPSVGDAFLRVDDPYYVTNNDAVKRGLTLDGVYWAFTTDYFLNWLPVTWLSHMLDVTLYGLEPAGHHLTSVLLHATNAGLAFAALRSLTGARWRSLAAGAVFAVHPLRVESVAWIAERKDVLCATFFLLVLLAYGAYARRPTGWRYAGVAVLLALGLMSKTMLVTVPPLLLILDWWPLRRGRSWFRDGGTGVGEGETAPPSPAADGRAVPARSWGWLVLEKLPLLALAAAASAWTVVLQSTSATELTDELSLAQRLGNAAVSVWRYVGKIALPVNLSPFYPHPGWWPTGWVVAAAILLVAASAAAVAVRRRRPYLLAGWLWFLGTLFPVSGALLHAGRQAMADRYTYLPGIGLAVALAWGVGDLVRGRPAARRLAVVAGSAGLAVFACVTLVQQQYWRNDLDLFSYGAAVDPNDWWSWQAVGRAYVGEGRPDLAVENFARSLTIEPRNEPLRLEYATLLLTGGNAQESAAQFRELVRGKPLQPEFRVGLALALAASGRPAEADAEFAEAVRLKPASPDALARWALELARQGRNAEAGERANAALKLDPDNDVAAVALRRANAASASRPAVVPGPAPLPGPAPIGPAPAAR